MKTDPRIPAAIAEWMSKLEDSSLPIPVRENYCNNLELVIATIQPVVNKFLKKSK